MAYCNMGAKGAAVGLIHNACARSLEMMRVVNAIIRVTRIWADCVVIGALVLVVYYAMDREPPFEMLSVEPAEARAGDWVSISMKVKRDPSRECDAQISRFMIDSTGAEIHIGNISRSAESFRLLELQSPGEWRTRLRVPSFMPPGKSLFRADNQYVCNKTQKLLIGKFAWLWPIRSTTEVPFTVLP